MELQRERVALLAACIVSALLVACGGGSGGGTVRNPTPVHTPPPPPPPPLTRSLQLPPDPIAKVPPAAPPYDNPSAEEFINKLKFFQETFGTAVSYDAATGNFVVDISDPNRGPVFEFKTRGSLVKQGSQAMGLFGSRYDGGIRLDAGTLRVWDDVHADITIAPGAMLDFGNEADIIGNVDNRGVLDATEGSGPFSDPYYTAAIFGDYRQSAEATLRVHLWLQGKDPATPLLTVTGKATLDGTLEFRPSGFIPSGGYLEWVLHAHGGISGQFSRWTSPGLLIDGTVRYDSKNVWLELTRASVATAMASNGIASPLTLASAATLDRVLSRADGFALKAPDSLSDAQRSLLASSGSVLRIADINQATRTLDSLSGATHADALEASLQQGIGDAESSRRMASMQPGLAAGAWSGMRASGRTSGFDQWLSPRLLVGVQAGQGSNDARDTFGQSTRLSPHAGAYLRWFGDDGWYAGGSAGYAQHKLVLDRTIDLGRGGQWNAHSRHRFNVAGVQGEAGRRLPLAGGTLTPYVALDATALRSEGTIEQGGTGFEMALQPAMRAQLGAGLGLRYGREWRLGDSGWLRLEADARLQRRLADAGDPLRAAFVGVPDLWFDLPSHANRTSGWLALGLHGGFGRDWTWSFAYARAVGVAPTAGPDWRVGLHRSF